MRHPKISHFSHVPRGAATHAITAHSLRSRAAVHVYETNIVIYFQRDVQGRHRRRQRRRRTHQSQSPVYRIPRGVLA